MNEFIIDADGEEFVVNQVSTLEDQAAFEYYYGYVYGHDSCWWLGNDEPEQFVWKATCWHSTAYALEFDDALEIAARWEIASRMEGAA